MIFGFFMGLRKNKNCATFQKENGEADRQTQAAKNRLRYIFGSGIIIKCIFHTECKTIKRIEKLQYGISE